MQTLASVPLRKSIRQVTHPDDANDLLSKCDISGLPFTLVQLRILKAISIAGSFKQAAEFLYVSPPTVSCQIHNLENQLGLRLFDRCGQHNEITEAGLLVLDYAERILQVCQDTCRAVHDLHDFRKSTLFLGASQTPGTYLVPRLMGLFRQQCPEISLQVKTQPTPKTCLDIVNGQLDLAIVEGDIPTELQASLEVIAFTEDELVLVVSAVHPLEGIYKVKL